MEGAVQVDTRLEARDERTLAEDVLDGLTRPFKELPPKHFYDAHGSELFERICELPEYYPTRTERRILRDHAEPIATATAAAEVVELGAGYATKTRVLLDALTDAGTLARYVPVDVSEVTVRACAEQLVAEYPGLSVHGLVGDFERHLVHLPAPAGPRLIVFLGGTIGNFLPGARRRFLRDLRAWMAPGDHLLLGTDLVKEAAVIEAAYDDAAGVTAEFNRNVLRVVNRELEADFDVDAFEHVAFFDPDHEWIEMRLRARARQTVSVEALGLTVRFARGEEMRTEISAKFTAERLEADLRAAGLELSGWFSDPDDLFAVTLSRPA
ncbi:MAG TPA: L-histidine N(alpha)-methyltransferase [Solirubrobacteraceae bacterium]|nr:L-histidine N(alpha)-methyltransferase [Solirubrobacteraceae bacterium]